MSIDWKQGKWPEQKCDWWFESGDWRVEIGSNTWAYRIVVRRNLIMVDSRRIDLRGDGMTTQVKHEAEAMFNSAIDRDAQPQHKSHL